MSSQPTENHFSVHSSHEDFNSRSNDIFGVLDVIEKKHTAEEKAREKSKSKTRDSDHEEERKAHHTDRCTEGKKQTTYDHDDRSDSRGDRTNRQAFKHPSRPPPKRFLKRNRPPDHRINPGRWTRYDLSDVSADQLTEASNSAAAFSFLNERRKLRETETDLSNESNSHNKIVFSKPKELKDSKPVTAKSTISSFSGARVQEEYVVGQKKARQAKETATDGLSCDKVDLGFNDGGVSNDREDAGNDDYDYIKTEEKEAQEDSEKLTEKSGFKQIKRKKRNTRQKLHESEDGET